MLHIVVCDDEETFAAALARQIEALPDFAPRTMGGTVLTDPAGLTETLPCDLLFLDIDLGAANGIEVARHGADLCDPL